MGLVLEGQFVVAASKYCLDFGGFHFWFGKVDLVRLSELERVYFFLEHFEMSVTKSLNFEVRKG